MMTFSAKVNGRQLGIKMKIEINKKTETKVFTYHIKTHQYGSRQHNINRGKCDIKELFAYKALNRIGILPQFHFYYYLTNKNIQFCIATLDANDYFKLSLEKNCNNSNITFSNEKLANELIIEENPEFSYYITFVYIISRIFLLSDILSNQNNYIFIKNGSLIKLFLYDLQAPPANYYGYQSKPIFSELLSGTQALCYNNFIQNILVKRLQSSRIKDVKRVMKYLEENELFFISLKNCYDEIREYFSSPSLEQYKFENYYDSDPNKNQYDDFNLYVMYLKINFTQFSRYGQSSP